MSLRVTWIIGAVVIVAAIVAGVWYWRAASTQTSVEDFNQARQTTEEVSIGDTVATPSTNPLEAAAPTVNPVEKTNPFKSEYANPFE